MVIVSGHHQTSGDKGEKKKRKRKVKEKSTSEDRENFSKSSSIAKISSKWINTEVVRWVRYSGSFLK